MASAAVPQPPPPPPTTTTVPRTFVGEFTVWFNNLPADAAAALRQSFEAEVVHPMLLGTPGVATNNVLTYVKQHLAVDPDHTGPVPLPVPLPKLVRFEAGFANERFLKGRGIVNLRLVVGFLTAYKIGLRARSWRDKAVEVLTLVGHAASVQFLRVRFSFTGRHRDDPLYRDAILQEVAEAQQQKQQQQAGGGAVPPGAAGAQ